MSDQQLRAHRCRQGEAALRATLALPKNRRTDELNAAIHKFSDSDRLTRIGLLWHNSEITGKELWRLLLDQYFDVNNPSVHTRDLLSLFRDAHGSGGPIRRDDSVLIPDKPVTLFRGALPDWRRGISWTTSRAVAKKFADRAGGCVYTVTVDPEHILGAFEAIGEYEFFVDYEKISEPLEV